jgi:hypothetical protein
MMHVSSPVPVLSSQLVFPLSKPVMCERSWALPDARAHRRTPDPVDLVYSAGQQNMTNLVVPELDVLRENGPWIRSQGG